MEAGVWAREQFGGAVLGDRRRVDRLVETAAAFADRPAGIVTGVFDEPKERRGAYRLFSNPAVTPEAVASSSYQATARSCGGQPFVWVPVDGSSLRFKDPTLARGTGPIGAQKFGARGFVVMSALAVAEDGAPIGLLGMEWWAREEAKVVKASKRPLEEKETRHWLAVLASVRRLLVETGCRPWFQLDRGGDAWPVMLVAHDASSWTTVRASYDRRLHGDGPDGERSYLWPTVAGAAPLGRFSLAVAASPTRRARVATLEVRGIEVTLSLRNHHTKVRHPVRVWAVCARETDESAGGEEPLEWMLLTTYPVVTFEDACLVVFGYSQRWRIEEFHKAWKTGVTDVEQSQLHTEHGLHVEAIVLATVAARLLRLTYVARRAPELPARVEYSANEVAAVLALKGMSRRVAESATVGLVTRWIAELGGYTGKSSGGPPGFVVLRRGMVRVEAVALALANLAAEGVLAGASET